MADSNDKLIEVSDGEDTYYLFVSEIMKGLAKAGVSLGSHASDLKCLRVTQEELKKIQLKLKETQLLLGVCQAEQNLSDFYKEELEGQEALAQEAVKCANETEQELSTFRQQVDKVWHLVT